VAKNQNYIGMDLSRCSLAGQDLTGANFKNANLSNVNFAGATLAGVILDGATLTGANLYGVVSSGSPGSPKALPTGWVLSAGILFGRGANLAGLDISEPW
jgi:uncharacterized protein YjbI with pentapeptide repeats